MTTEASRPPRPARGDEIEVEIGDLAFGGQGVGRSEGFVVFCPDTVPGDRARVSLRKVRRRFGEAQLVEVVSPGPDRIAPPCAHVPDCGGCRLQHVAYEATLHAKRNQVAEHLARIGHLEDIPVLEMDPAVERFGYRNKMEYSAAPGPDGELRLGFHRRGRWDEIVDIRHCMLATPVADAVRETVRRWAADANVVPYDQRTQTGWLRHVMVREGVNTGQLLVTLVTAPGGEDLVDSLADPLFTAHPGAVGFLHAINDGMAETTQGLEFRVVRGQDWLEEKVMGITLKLSAGAFFQTNTRMTETLYGRVAEAAGFTGNEVLYDLFAGVGSIGICMADKTREVVAVEIVPEAVRDAEENARRNGLTAHRALCGDVGKLLRERAEELPPADVAVVDPPRAGLSGRAVRRILELSPKVLVYVSCQPATFADNARRFVDGGYRLEWVRPVDMFPQTPHIEAVSRFVKD